MRKIGETELREINGTSRETKSILQSELREINDDKEDQVGFPVKIVET